MPRANILFDAQNFSIACREYVGYYVNVRACSRHLARRTNHELGRVSWYDSPSPTPSVQADKNRFWDNLRNTGVEVKLGRTEPNPRGGHREKETDIKIAVDMVAGAFRRDYDLAILVSGDTDLAYAIEVVQGLELPVAWAHLPSQKHVDRFLQIVPRQYRILLEEKNLRVMRNRGPSKP